MFLPGERILAGQKLLNKYYDKNIQSIYSNNCKVSSFFAHMFDGEVALT